MGTEMAVVRRAFAAGEFELHYQPLVSMATQHVVGAEALLRWRRPDKGLTGPAEVLQGADAGWMLQLTRWVIREGIAQRATWPADLMLAVNVPPSLLTRGAVDEIADEISDACRTYETRPTNLCLEITEPPILDVDEARASLARLATMGVLVAADDFGAGATSLARLRDLPFHICKLDRSLVAETGPDSQLTAAIIDVAHALGMAVVAEGIEAANQYRAVVGAGADLGQGFHLHPPLPPRALSDLLRRSPLGTFTLPGDRNRTGHHVLVKPHDEVAQLEAFEGGPADLGPRLEFARVQRSETRQHQSVDDAIHDLGNAIATAELALGLLDRQESAGQSNAASEPLDIAVTAIAQAVRTTKALAEAILPRSPLADVTPGRPSRPHPHPSGL